MEALASFASSPRAPWEANSDNQTRRNVKSAERTLALFELFAVEQRALTVGQIARSLSMPQPSVTMLIGNLVRLGYLEHDRVARTYIPTIRIMLLSSWIHQRFTLDHGLEGSLIELSQELGETVLLALQNSIYCQYICVQQPLSPSRLEVQSGMLRPMTRTATGRVLLSLKSDTEVAAIARRCNVECAEHLRVNVSELVAEVGQARRAGFAETRGDMTDGAGVIAMALPSPVGSVPLAIGVGGPMSRLSTKRDEVLEKLRELRRRVGTRAPAPVALAS